LSERGTGGFGGAKAPSPGLGAGGKAKGQAGTRNWKLVQKGGISKTGEKGQWVNHEGGWGFLSVKKPRG